MALPLFYWKPAYAEPATVLLTPLPLEKVDLALTHEVLKILESELSQKNKEVKIAYPLEPQKNTPLVLALKEAGELQFNFQNKKAIAKLKGALEEFDRSIPSLPDLKKLADVYLFLAFCHKNEGNVLLMNQALDEAARFNPSLVPDEMIFPPSLVLLFEQAKDRIWAQGRFAQVMIDTSPTGADLFVNGAFKGKTPLRLDRYPIGEHHLYVKLNSEQSYQRVQFHENGNVPFKIKLGSGSDRQAHDKNSFLTLNQTEEWVQRQMESSGNKAGLGIGVIKRGNKIKVVVVPQGFEGVKSWNRSFDTDVLPRMIVKEIISYIKL